ncbi:MAG: hypothetical protein P8L45_06230, partial [Longimicrobiales bacterium]|nr:hypothetical protein [Longimicrobiales bacterium]
DGQAESLRRAMSRKRSREALTAHWEEFRTGAEANGVEETTAREIFAQVTAFSEFGFPKSHAAAFGLLAYQSAWLRHYYPVEFYVGLFNNQPMGFYSLDALGRDARRSGIRTLLPDINHSQVESTAEGNDLRIGLGFVRGWGANIAEHVVTERESGGPYRSLLDFLRRTPAALKRPAIENLIWVGGFGAFGLTRRELLWQTGLWLGPETDKERTGGRDDHAQTELALDDPYANLRFEDLDAHDQMIAEYRMLRFSADRHPLSLLQDVLPQGTVASDRLPHLQNGSTVRVSGLVTTRQRPSTAKGYVFVMMEDEHGSINLIIKPDIYQRDRAAVRMEPFLAVSGRLQIDGATINIIAHEVEALRVPGTLVQRRGLSRTLATEKLARTSPGTPPPASTTLPPGRPALIPAGATATHENVAYDASNPDRRPEGLADGTPGLGSPDLAHLCTSLPEPLEYWDDKDEPRASPYQYLNALRQRPPGIKNFG